LRRGGGRDRVHALSRHQAQRGGAARGLRARVLQRARPGRHGSGRPHRGQLREHLPGGGRGRDQGTEAPLKTWVAIAALLGAAVASAQETGRLAERAHQDREIVYFLRDPGSHAFDLYHDYTETREGMDRYINVVRQGSTVASPAARI